MSTPDLWFQAAPPATHTVGTVPGTGLRYSLEPAGVWALSGRPVQWQQRAHPEELVVMPDALLHGMGYRLQANTDAELPDSLTSIIEQGPQALNSTTHPFEPALMPVGPVELLALRRTFTTLQAYVSIHRGHWICALVPTGASPALLEAPIAT